VEHISQGWAASKSCPVHCPLNPQSYPIFSGAVLTGNFWLSWGEGQQNTISQLSQKASSAFCCQATSWFYSRSSCGCC